MTKVKKIVAFGCSWTYGDELVDPTLELTDLAPGAHHNQNENYRLHHCFAGQVASHFDLELENLAFPGSSLESMRWNLNWWINNSVDKEECLIVAGLTDASRQSWYNPRHVISDIDPPWNRHMHGTWLKQPNPDIDENWFKLQKLFLGMSYHRNWAEFNYQQTIMMFDHVRLAHNVPVVQINTLLNEYPSACPSLLYPNNCFKNILSAQNNRQNPLFCINGHPNENGHKIIADHLIKHIKSSIILE